MTPGNKLGLMMAVCLSLIPASVYAQGSTASLAGTVRDEQSLIVPGAAVALAAIENTFSRTVTTGPSGAFEFAGLLPFNTVNYGTPNRFVNTPQFGTITEAATSARQIQFVVRTTF